MKVLFEIEKIKFDPIIQSLSYSYNNKKVRYILY